MKSLKSTFIPWVKPTLFGDEDRYLLDALKSTWISGGPYVERLERIIPDHLGMRYGIAVSNGTSALQLGLLGLGVGPGDQVIVPGYTFAAAINMVLAVGATPVFADINPDTWCIDVKEVERAITRHTRAVIPVHLYGNVANMPALMALARAHGLAVVEDTAESAFSLLGGRFAGTFGDIGTLSFQATKTITTGEGGMVLTDDSNLCSRMLTVRDHGMPKDKRYWHEVVGFNFRLTNLQAALGCAQFERLDSILTERRRVYERYCSALADIPEIEMQHFSEGLEAVVWTVAVRLWSDRVTISRDELMQGLLEKGIETRPGFYTPSDIPLYDCPLLPVSQQVSEDVLCLPAYPKLKDSEIDHVCEMLKQILDDGHAV
jgi:perosamine synthetase